MSYGNSGNPYDNPEKYGLEIAYSDDQGASYDFDMFVVWRSINGSLFYATDEGCSCPAPFENLGAGTDYLEPVGPRQVVDRYREWLESGFDRSGDTQPLQSALASHISTSREV